MSIQRLLAVALIASLFLLASPGARAADDRAVLEGLKDGKIVFDITQDEGKALLDRLVAVQETRKALAAQGVTPHLVVTFRGGATRLVQTDPEKVKPEDRPLLPQIAAKLAELGKTAGIESVEQCGAAVRKHGTNPELVMPPIKVVGNSFISLMAYQSRGYAYIRP